MSISLFILLWICGALVTLSVIARSDGEVTGGDLCIVFAWPVGIALGIVIPNRNTVIWRKRS